MRTRVGRFCAPSPAGIAPVCGGLVGLVGQLGVFHLDGFQATLPATWRLWARTRGRVAAQGRLPLPGGQRVAGLCKDGVELLGAVAHVAAQARELRLHRLEQLCVWVCVWAKATLEANAKKEREQKGERERESKAKGEGGLKGVHQPAAAAPCARRTASASHRLPS